ncbi:MAG: triose-phosphate isomerase [Thermoplasmata archaeon]
MERVVKLLRTPVLVVNYKIYDVSFGQKALELTKVLEKVSLEYGVEIGAAVTLPDIRLIAPQTKIPVLSQHADAIDFGSHTGFTHLENLKDAGAVGTLINHSEHRLKLADIEFLVEKCRKLGLISIVCTNNVATSCAAAALEPDFVAVEPPELIGGDIAVSTAKPEVISGTVDKVKRVSSKVKVLCGAGVKTGKDVAKAIELGSEGILLASGIVKAKDWEKATRDIVSGMLR